MSLLSVVLVINGEAMGGCSVVAADGDFSLLGKIAFVEPLSNRP